MSYVPWRRACSTTGAGRPVLKSRDLSPPAESPVPAERRLAHLTTSDSPISFAPGDSPEDIARDVSAVGQIDAVPTLLEVLCSITGMRFAAVARVTGNTWTACAVKDDINFGLKAGGQLDLETTLCIEVKRDARAIVIEHASHDERYRDHHTPKLYHIESYVSVPIVFRDGRYFGNLCAIDPSPAKIADPKIISMFTSFAQLIALQLESELTHQQSQAALRDERAASELRDQFIAILGHDLRNPLQAVAASGELLERQLTDPKLIGLAGRIRTNARRMSSLIDDVLDFARGRLGGGISLRVSAVNDIDTALQAVVRELQDGQPDRQIIADLRVDRAVSCDIGRIQQIASNLLGNALAHGAAHSPVRVTARADDQDFILDVWNAGDPIPAESIGRIFEPFWRNSTDGNRQGLGLGLHICSQIVRAHGGKLSVTSAQDEGTRFTARLPLR
jgi:signal transduction histidine kinase